LSGLGQGVICLREWVVSRSQNTACAIDTCWTVRAVGAPIDKSGDARIHAPSKSCFHVTQVVFSLSISTYLEGWPGREVSSLSRRVFND